MGDRMLLDPDLAPALRAAGLDGAEALCALGGAADAAALVTRLDLEVAGTSGRFHLKRYRYPDWRKAKGLLGRGTLWGQAPTLAEFRALAWLRRHDLPAVRPVAAAARTRRGLLAAQMLLTEHVPDAPDLAARLDDPRDPLAIDAYLRRDVLASLADLLASMHDAGFVHGDAYPRNVLVGGGAPAVRLVLLDCRRGGPPGRRRRVADDLSAMARDLEVRLAPAECLRALARYARRRDLPARDLLVAMRAARRRERRPPR